MGIVVRIAICVVILATVRCEYLHNDERISLRKLRQVADIPNWPPPTVAPNDPDDPIIDTIIPDWPPPTELPPTEPPTDPEDTNDSSAWMVTAIVFIVLFVITVGICIYMFATLPPRYSTNKTFTLPRVNTPAH